MRTGWHRRISPYVLPALILAGWEVVALHHAGILPRYKQLVERLTFFNTLLFPPILVARLAMRVRPPRALRSENEIGGRVANRIAELIFSAEAPFLERADLPIGVSLACVARRRTITAGAHGVV